MASIFMNIRELEKAGHETNLLFQLGDPYIDQARNHIVHAFLKTNYTDLIFVDTDLSFDSDAMLKLMRNDVGVVGGAYPYRSETTDGFPVKIKIDENKFPVTDYEKGLVECDFVPTGFMRINRSVFGKIYEKYPERIDDTGEIKFFTTGQLHLNDCDNRWWGEDVYFCKVCNDIGIKVYCEPMINFVHIGTLHKKGHYGNVLQNGGKVI
ncbi:MAG: hypothetical protein M0R74_11340 [Dehalococcoidia bacterium]|nr:hypothetical protein [Dehalococcoidia bacterium]